MNKRALIYEILSRLNKIGRFIYRNKLRVLAYHKVENKNSFQLQVEYLKKYYNVISIEDIITSINSNVPLKPNSLLITFDDGDVSVFKNAYPLLKKNNFPAVLFVITELINSKKPFWWEEVEYYLGKVEGEKMSWRIKELPNKERLNFLKELRLGSKKPLLNANQLTSGELKEMHDSGIRIANHSHTHPMFDKCNENELSFELKKSIKILKSHNLEPLYFAYPNGNWDNKSEKLLSEYNLKLGFLFDHKLTDLSNPLRISRIRVDASSHLPEFKAKVSGIHSILYNKSIS